MSEFSAALLALYKGMAPLVLRSTLPRMEDMKARIPVPGLTIGNNLPASRIGEIALVMIRWVMSSLLTVSARLALPGRRSRH